MAATPFQLQADPAFQLEPWGYVPPAQPLTVSVSAQRVATLTNIPAGSTATDYEYQFRPAPAVSAARVVDLSQTLAAGESATDYEYQLRPQ